MGRSCPFKLLLWGTLFSWGKSSEEENSPFIWRSWEQAHDKNTLTKFPPLLFLFFSDPPILLHSKLIRGSLQSLVNFYRSFHPFWRVSSSWHKETGTFPVYSAHFPTPNTPSTPNCTPVTAGVGTGFWGKETQNWMRFWLWSLVDHRGKKQGEKVPGLNNNNNSNKSKTSRRISQDQHPLTWSWSFVSIGRRRLCSYDVSGLWPILLF